MHRLIASLFGGLLLLTYWLAQAAIEVGVDDLMPVFLAYVRRHDAFEIGTIMLVTGLAQLVAAPMVGRLESRLDPRWLSAVGFALFAIGLGWSALQSRVADFDEMFWPQVLRGVAIMFCLLPPVRLALGR